MSPRTTWNGGAEITLAADALRTCRAVLGLKASSPSETPRILWVDDHPSNNRRLVESFERTGILVDLATDTDQALERIALRPYTAIISDMGRPPDMQAGYTLLDRLRRTGNATP